jgi:hypothetical protein
LEIENVGPSEEIELADNELGPKISNGINRIKNKNVITIQNFRKIVYSKKTSFSPSWHKNNQTLKS